MKEEHMSWWDSLPKTHKEEFLSPKCENDILNYFNNPEMFLITNPEIREIQRLSDVKDEAFVKYINAMRDLNFISVMFPTEKEYTSTQKEKLATSLSGSIPEMSNIDFTIYDNEDYVNEERHYQYVYPDIEVINVEDDNGNSELNIVLSHLSSPIKESAECFVQYSKHVLNRVKEGWKLICFDPTCVSVHLGKINLGKICLSNFNVIVVSDKNYTSMLVDPRHYSGLRYEYSEI